ncbi:hypothetical protein M2650_03250 [Luteimonas sp. SX5]|uniref:Right-handed parallel beta-helix repeat-containing protein n=1 Tax=Luteimonas galliterrae TaxID=2940486 RepID=A0ABT0MFN5_9GAMM|nr:choice-of-anchor Q domain-containing protein [Luteimonas galliterrae]MCL1633661.1 hypothetical protein [Luteimonas galliterrae]
MNIRVRCARRHAVPTTAFLLCFGALSLPTPASAATLSVANCNDSGSGSLRDTVAQASSGDTVDLTQLNCDQIKLAGTPIAIAQQDLNIVGPGRYKLAIDGVYKSGVLRHTGAGTLKLSHLSVEHGQHVVYDGDGNAYGGCVYSAGDVNIDWVEVRHCGAHARVNAGGGGIYAQRNVMATRSVVHSNGLSGAGTYGGGIAAEKSIALERSRIVNNKASSGGGLRAGIYGSISMHYSALTNNVARVGGGAEVFGKAEIINSAITGNSATTKDGALQINELTIVNSTVSGNSSPFISAIETRGGFVASNSTIAYNNMTGEQCRGAVTVTLYDEQLPPHLDSSIFANNTCKGSPSTDLDAREVGASTIVSITGANNLVMQGGASTELPEDTVSADPLLQPLTDNGGVRLTHALMAGSPAIDAGNNAAGLVYDQRGPSYPRTKGAGTDIGAYER